MFNNLKIEMIQADLSKMDLAKEIGISYNTIRAKFKGRTEWKINEMLQIQNILNKKNKSYKTIDELFKK